MALDLWQIRRQKRMTIDELARRSGIHPALIKAYELGERTIPERDLERLAKVLMVETWDIKELSEPPPRGPARPSGPSLYEGEEGPPRSDPGPRYDQGSRYDQGPRYDQGSRYGNDYGRPSYGSDNRRSGYGSEGGRGGYGNERGGYGSESGRGGYNRDTGRGGYQGGEGSSYGGGYGRSDYGSDRSSQYGGERPPARPGQRPPYRPDRPDRMQQRPPKKNGMRRRPQMAPARPSQLEHLKLLLLRLDMSGEDLLRLAGKPLSMLNRKEAAQLLTTCQNMLSERRPERPKGKRQRPYLPESVDEHELVYLTEVQLDKRPIQLTLFNGETIEGQLLGFSPYALTLTKPDGQEVTVQKLAVAFYEVEPGLVQETNGEDPEL